jgi:hypothetical protein
MWEYVGGGNTTPPALPKKIKSAKIQGLNEQGEPTTIVRPGNDEEYNTALAAAQPWHHMDKRAKALIFNAIPSSHFHLVHQCTTANMAWISLKQAFMPANAERGAHLRRKILQYVCRGDMNVDTYLDDQLKMYVELTQVDPGRLSDQSFYEAIVDMLPTTGAWLGRVSIIRDKIDRWQETQNTVPSSMQVLQWIRDQNWLLTKDKPDSNIHVYSAKYEADNKLKRSRPDSTSQNLPPKRARTNVRNPDLTCDNPHCSNKIGHIRSTCIAHGGGQEGKYPDWWKGPWNLHMEPGLRTRTNNVPPVNHPKHLGNKMNTGGNSLHNRISAAPTTNYTSTDIQDSRNSYGEDHKEVIISSAELNNGVIAVQEALPTGTFDNATPESVLCHASALDPKGPVSDDCIHDSAANRHVFHSKESFDEYNEITPVKVKGFGKELSTCAIGKGTVIIKSFTERGTHRTLKLRNCLHIPTARFNLISQSQLDRAGLSSSTSNGTVSIHRQGDILMIGSLGEDDMYRLSVSPTRANGHLNNSLITALSNLSDDNNKVSLEDFITAFLGI